MREQQKCVYVRCFRFPTFFSLCARSVKSRDLLRQLPRPPPHCPHSINVLHNGCGDGTCKSGERGTLSRLFLPHMSACSYKYYVYAVADAAQGKRRPQMELFAINIRHIYIHYNFYRFTLAVHSLPLGWSCWFCSQTSTCPSRWR